MKKTFIILTFILLNPISIWAIGGKSYISTTHGKDYFNLSTDGKSSPLVINSNDYTGVIRALQDLKTDIGKVTGVEPSVVFDTMPAQKEVVIVGTLGKSTVIDRLIKSGKIDVKGI